MQKAIKKLLSLMLTLSFIPVVASPVSYGAETAPVFKDIAGHWAESDIEYLYNAGLVSGMSETEFAPDVVIDKAQFITMLTRALGIEPDIYSINYSDVSPLDDWFAGYLGAAVNAGIIEDSVFAFMPDSSVSRGTVASMMYKAIVFEGLDAAQDTKAVVYADVPESDTELAQAVSAVSAIGVMVGQTENEFAPDETLTRAEAAAVVKRLSIAASTVGEVAVPLNISEVNSASVDDGVISLNGDYSYVAIDNVDFHYGINRIKFSASASVADLQLEVWIDSLNPIDGAKLGTVVFGSGGAAFEEQSALISRTYGAHKVYLRLIGAGNVSLKDVVLKTDELPLSLSKYSRIYMMKRSGSTITNLKYGGYVDFDAVDFGAGYDTIEFTMKNSTAGQLFEIWLDDRKAAVVETVDSGEEGVTFQTSIVRAEEKKNLSIKPIMDVDGTITDIRFYNNTGKADLCLDADAAETSLSISQSEDYTKGNETDVISDGDVIKFPKVNMSDGYNVLSMRIKNEGIKNSALSIVEDGEETGFLMGIFSGGDDDARIEVRLDGEDGMLVGTLKENPIKSNSSYDIQSCYLHGVQGIHDLYLKAVGDTGWKFRFIKLQQRGWYDIPMTTLEAEDMDMYLAEATDPNDVSRYAPHEVSSEASGKAAVKIEQNGGYVEFVVPEWYKGGENRTAITVRHSIPDFIDENNYSIGQDGAMRVTVNGRETMLLNSFDNFSEEKELTLSSKCTRGYGNRWGIGEQGLAVDEYSSYFFNDAYAVIKGEVKAGDVIRLIPEINEAINYCYIDCVDIEEIPEAKAKPEGYLSITECGAVPNDGQDDGEALRKAVAMVKDDPYTYTGIWIPEGLFDIRSYVGDRSCTAADLSGIRVLGAGPWHAQLLAHLGTWTLWAANYNTGENTIIRDVALHGTTIARGWTLNGKTLGAIAISGTGTNFIENVWFEHWNANVWLSNASGVFARNRVKNTWADGFNSHESSYGIIYEKNYMRSTGDDALAIFSSNERGTHMARNVKIANNTVIGIYWATGIAIWGGEDINIDNNLVCDIGLHCGIALPGWGFVAPATDNVWIRNNRLERCGNVNEGNQDNGAFGLTPGKHSDSYNGVYKNTYFENNECIDNPSVFMRISSQGNADDVFLGVRYNYIRNTCLAFPERRRIIDYKTNAVKGKITYAYNILEGDYEKFKTSNTTQMTDVLIGNMPENWK